MFGMSFGNSAPTPSQEKVVTEELIDSLRDSGMLGLSETLSSQDQEAVKSRMQVIENKRAMDSDTAAVLAYVDRMILLEKNKGNVDAANMLASKISTDLISAVVHPEHASNEEFLSTVLNLAQAKYASGNYVVVSDALLEAVEEREAAISEGSTIKIDGQENVILPTDQTMLQ